MMMINNLVYEDIKELIRDAIGEVTGNDMKRISYLIESAEKVDGVRQQLDDVVNHIVKKYREFTEDKISTPGYMELRMYIENRLYEMYISHKFHGAVTEWRPTTNSVRISMEKVERILSTYERESSDWAEKAAEKIKDLDDPVASTIFEWCVR